MLQIKAVSRADCEMQGRQMSPDALLGDARNPADDEDEEAFLEGEEDDVDEEHLLLDGPDFSALDNAFQQGLEDEGLEGEPPEVVRFQPSVLSYQTLWPTASRAVIVLNSVNS